MGRKKNICSVNAALQVDGKIHYTFRSHGQEVAINQLQRGHAHKIYRSLIEMKKLMKRGLALDYIDKQIQQEERDSALHIIHDIFSHYPNNPTLSRIRQEIDNAMEVH